MDLSQLPYLPTWQPQSFFRLVHGLCAAIPFWGVLYMHVKVLKDKDVPLDEKKASNALHIHHWMLGALCFLWVSGVFGICAGVYSAAGSEYVINPKLWTKIGVVTAISGLAYCMHTVIIPKMVVGFTFLEESLWFQTQATLLGAMSITGWGWAIALGYGREWSKVVPTSTLFFYIFFSLLGICALSIIYLAAINVIKKIKSRIQRKVQRQPQRKTTRLSSPGSRQRVLAPEVLVPAKLSFRPSVQTHTEYPEYDHHGQRAFHK